MKDLFRRARRKSSKSSLEVKNNDSSSEAASSIKTTSAGESHGPSLHQVEEKSGYLHTLTDEQRTKLYQLWAIFALYLDGRKAKGEGQAGGKGKDEDETINQEEALEIGKKLAEQITSKQSSLDSLNFLDLASKEAKIFFLQAHGDDLDTVMLRFLRARKWDLPAAFAMLIECCQWRLTYGTHELCCEGESRLPKGLMASGKAFIWGEDRSGRVTCYVRARLHDKTAQPLEESADYLVYWMETGRSLRQYDEQMVTLVLDLEGAGLASLDTAFASFMLKCLEAYYPEILGQALLVSAPWMFWGFWRLLSPLLDPVVAAKIKFIKKDQLGEYIDEDQLPVEFGGPQSSFNFSEAFARSQQIPARSVSKAAKEDPGLTAQLRALQHRLISLNKEILNRLLESDNPKMDELFRERDEVKSELRTTYERLVRLLYPPSMYERLGLINEKTRRVEWSRYQPPQEDDDIKSEVSAPAVLEGGSREPSPLVGRDSPAFSFKT